MCKARKRKPKRPVSCHLPTTGPGQHHCCHVALPRCGQQQAPPPLDHRHGQPRRPATKIQQRHVATWTHEGADGEPLACFVSARDWKTQRKGETAVLEAQLIEIFRGRTLRAPPTRQTQVGALVPIGDAATSSPLASNFGGTPGDLLTPGLLTPDLTTIVEALARHPGFAAAIAARVFSTPAVSAAEMDDVLMAPPADSKDN